MRFMEGIIMRYLDFDDVLIEPVPSTVNSRNDVDISVTFKNGFRLEFPLIISPMPGIIDGNLAAKISDLGGIGILHKFYDSPQELYNDIKIVAGKNFGISIGLYDNSYDALLNTYSPKILCVDLANGYLEALLRFSEKIKSYIVRNNLNVLLMTGNVATQIGAQQLANSGVDIIRYGIGGGELCTTRNVTGIGIPSISALEEVADGIENAYICADGGIRNSGDFVKAIVAGADLAMAGSLFGRCYESPNDGKIYGAASKELNERKYTQVKSVEGISKAIKKEYSLKEFVDTFSWGIKSAGTYLNSRNLNDMRIMGNFVTTGTGSIKKL